MEHLDDIDLIKRIQNGDVLAFEVVVKRYQQVLFTFVRRIVRDDAPAEDITQEVLFKMYTRIDQIDLTKKFSTYLFEIAKNKSIDYLRTKKHMISIDDVELIDEDVSLYDLLVIQDAQTHIAELINSLPKQYQTVITMYYFEDLSYEEIAQKLSLPINTVRTHLRRAKAALLQLLTV